MKINLLRQKILDLAIRGKLVPQDPNDEPASVLLERIRAEKDRLIAEGKIKRPKKAKATSSESHYQKFTPPFAIPESWEWVDFENIFDNINSTPYQIKQSIIQPFGKYEVISQGQNEIDGYSDDDTKVFRFGNSCIVFGDHTLNVKFRNKEFVVGADGVKLLLPKIYPKYGYLLIQWRANNIKKRGYSRHFQFISNSKFPIPPYLEQQRIVRIFNNIISLVDDIEANKSLLFGKIRNAKSKILDLAMQGKLVPQDPADEPSADMLRRINPKAKIITDNPQYQQLPLGWSVAAIRDVFEMNPKNNADEEIEAGFVPMASIADGFNDSFDCTSRKWKEIKNGFTHFADGDIAVAKISPCLENRKSMILRNLPNGIGSGTTELLVFRSNAIYPEYGLLFFKSDSFINHCVGTFNGVVGQQRVGKNIVEDILIPIPPLEEQKRIVKKVNALFGLLNEIESNLLTAKS